MPFSPSIDTQAFNDFFYFINERHKIYLKKTTGRPKPWTDDPILRDWKFCNVFRQYDKQSKLLIDNVIKPHWNDDPALMLFNIYAFRAFNWARTYSCLVEGMGQNNWLNRWEPKEAQMLLWNYNRNQGLKLTSGAYMIRGREGIPKYESIVQTLTTIWETKDEIITKFTNPITAHTLEALFATCDARKFWGWGEFTTYQIVLDCTYSPILENPDDINTWCIFGPGAIRGIHEIYPELPKNMMLQAARGLLLDSPKFIEGHVPTLTLQDCEFALCELQKYRRIKAGGRSKERYSGAA